MLAFHDGGATPGNQEEISHCDALADRERFIVAYPEGVGKSWAEVDVVWYEIEGGGHRWPPHQTRGIAEWTAGRVAGPSSQNIDASEELWQFFAAHPRHP